MRPIQFIGAVGLISCPTSHSLTTTRALVTWQTLELARVKAGDRVLVHAGSGGMGTFAIQLAKERGAVVATTCSAHNAEFVKEVRKGKGQCSWHTFVVLQCCMGQR